MTLRTIARILPGQPATDGAGVRIHRLALTRQAEADPFLLLDELRSDDRADFVGGFPPHPHRGMETLTVMLDGGIVHEDHLGNRGEIRAGGAQWMSAGRGIVHGEMPTPDSAGLHGFQLWINLPASRKMQPPDYRDVPAAEIPAREGEGWRLRAIGGDWQLDGIAVSGPLSRLAAEAAVAELTLAPGAAVRLEGLGELTLLAYVFDGALAAPARVPRGSLAFSGAGEALGLAAGPAGARLLLLRGRALREPVASYGPFVMNTAEEIEQAIRDYREGRLGT